MRLDVRVDTVEQRRKAASVRRGIVLSGYERPFKENPPARVRLA